MQPHCISYPCIVAETKRRYAEQLHTGLQTQNPELHSYIKVCAQNKDEYNLLQLKLHMFNGASSMPDPVNLDGCIFCIREESTAATGAPFTPYKVTCLHIVVSAFPIEGVNMYTVAVPGKRA